MLTPRFEITQTDEEVTIIIHAPYANIKDAEVYVDGTDFLFSSTPYFLKWVFANMSNDFSTNIWIYLSLVHDNFPVLYHTWDGSFVSWVNLHYLTNIKIILSVSYIYFLKILKSICKIVFKKIIYKWLYNICVNVYNWLLFHASNFSEKRLKKKIIGHKWSNDIY